MNSSRHSRSVLKYFLPGRGVRSSSLTEVGSGIDVHLAAPHGTQRGLTATTDAADPERIFAGSKEATEKERIYPHRKYLSRVRCSGMAPPSGKSSESALPARPWKRLAGYRAAALKLIRYGAGRGS